MRNPSDKPDADFEQLSRFDRADRICDEYEQEWLAKRRPILEDYLARVPEEERAGLRRELKLIQRDYERLSQEGKDTPVVRPGALTADDAEGTESEAEHPPARALVRSPAIPSDAADESSIQVGSPSTFGDYELLEEIARGGMGVVFKARQKKADRIVALKMILSGDLAGEEEIRRFQAEAAAAASLDHPNIVPIFDVGEHDGRQYFSMGFVDGQSLRERTREAPLTSRMAADCVRTIAGAVAFAHDKGIVHRDLKPSNVLLDGQETPKVTDFGLAKRIRTDSRLTATGAIVGTPSYMAPEQATGSVSEIGPLTDVYALGALLFELLTGRPPFKADTQVETLRQVVDQAPIRPRQLNTSVDRDLDTICLKCLEKDPARRYSSARSLADDLGRYLDGRPIAARPLGPLPKSWRWCRRNRLATAVILLTCALVVGAGAVGFRYQGERTRLAVERATRDAELKERARNLNLEMTKVLDEAERGHEELHARLAEPRFVHELLSDIDQWRRTIESSRAVWLQADRLAGSEPRPLLEDEVVDRLARVDKDLRADEHDYELARKLDTIRQNSKLTVDGQWKPNASVEEYSETFRQAGFDIDGGDVEAVSKGIRESSIRFALVAALDHWAKFTWRPFEILAFAQRADVPDTWRKRFRSEDVSSPEATRRLAEEIDVERQSPQVIASFTSHLSDLHIDSVPLLRRALVRYPKDYNLHFELGIRSKDPLEKVGGFRAALAVRPDSSACHVNLGVLLKDLGDLDGATAHCRKAIEIDPSLAMAYCNLGNIQWEVKDTEGALKNYREAIAMDPDYHDAYRRLGSLLLSHDDVDEATGLCRTAMDGDPDISRLYVELGRALGAKGTPESAVRLFEWAIDVDPRNADAHRILGHALLDKGDLDGAVLRCRRAIEIDPGDGRAYVQLGLALARTGDSSEAGAQFRRAVDIDPENSSTYIQLGLAMHQLGDVEGGIRHFRKAIEIDPESHQGHHDLGHSLVLKGDLDEAITHFRVAIDVNPDASYSHFNLGLALRSKGDLEGAVTSFRRAIDIDPDCAEAYAAMGETYAKEEDIDGAIACYAKAIDIDPDDALLHYNLARFFRAKGNLDDAVTSYRNAVAIDPGYAEAHCNLAILLGLQGKFVEALESVRRGHQLGSERKNWKYPSARWVARAERRVELDRKVSAVLRGEEDAPTEASERLEMATLLFLKKYYADAARFFAEAFDDQPTLFDDPRSGHRFAATRATAMAVAEFGAENFGDEERNVWSGRARAWFKADLDAWSRLLDRDPGVAPILDRQLRNWRTAPELAGVRDEPLPARLSLEERDAWRRQWLAAQELLDRLDSHED